MPVPEVTALSQNYPNPFNPATSIDYTVGGIRGQGLGVRNVRLVVYDLLGREVRVLVDEKKSPGSYVAKLNGSDLSSGVYFYRLVTENSIHTRKMILLK